jgi:hypothetical protein
VKPPINPSLIDQATPLSETVGGADQIGAFAVRRSARGQDRRGAWLQCAAGGLCVLAAAAAAVSFTAQYRLVYSARRLALIAGLEAAIPDAAALVFACLGVALALYGRRALRARVLNVASAGASVFMNVIAAAPGWRDLAVWVMPPTAYALASDTLIGVVRAWVIARHQALDTGLAADDATLLAVAGGLVLWLLRLSMAPASTLSGFRTWVLEECPVAPGRKASRHTPTVASGAAAQAVAPAASSWPGTAPPRSAAVPPRGRSPRKGTKTARFLALVTERHGPLAVVPLESVAKISAAVAPQVSLNTGSARAALRRAVLAAQDGERR